MTETEIELRRAARLPALALPLSILAACGTITGGGDDDGGGGAFTLVAPGEIAGRTGTTVAVDLELRREDGFDGDIEVAFDDLGPGVASDPVVVPAGADAGTIELELDLASPGSLIPLRLAATSGELRSEAELDLLVLGQPGELDPSFGDGGIVRSPTIDDLEITPVGFAALADGSLLVGGTGSGEEIVVKFTPDGRIDRSFADDGVFRATFADVGASFAGGGLIGLQQSGNIIVVGSGDPEPGDSLATLVPVLIRLTPDGRLDPTFAGGGVTVTDVLGNLSLTTLAIDGRDRILVGGATNGSNGSQAGIQRFTADGAPDTSFGDSGPGLFTRDIDFNDRINDVIVLRDGTVLATAQSNPGSGNPSSTPSLLALDDAGAPVVGFGTGGISHLGFTTPALFARVLPLPFGGLVVVGSTGGVRAGDLAVWGVTDAGDLDTTFARDGELTIAPAGADVSLAEQIVLDSDGKLMVVGGTFTGGVPSGAVAARLDASGRLDDGYGEGGVLELAAGQIGSSGAAVVDPLHLVTLQRLFGGGFTLQRSFN